MPYVEDRIVHDADSHVMETPDWLVPYADPQIRDRLEPLRLTGCKPGEETFIDELRARHRDPADHSRAEAKLMIHKNWSALGSFLKEDRPLALDLLGFASQLVFNTFLSDHFVRFEHGCDLDLIYGAARAHNRAIVDFCSHDREYVRRQIRATPYPAEPVGWIIEQAGEEVCLFLSDYPHVEGGRNPIRRFESMMGGVAERAKQRFYCDNFVDLMGSGLA